MEQWMNETLTKLKEMYEEYNESEPALEAYTVCMIRMLNGMAEMEHSQLYLYEKKTIWKAMEMAVSHFIGQVDLARKTKDVKRKKHLIDDIEDSVSMLTSVYKNVIDGTTNSDRYMMSSMAVDTNMFDLSPKLCAFYSEVLNGLVTIFSNQDGKYAFLLHPTLRNNTETKLLFEEREKSGKVAIIYISQSFIEEFGVVTVCLIHEAFHVLTRTPRLRKRRWRYFFKHMLAGVRQLIFEEVNFCEDTKKNERIKEQLFKYWMDFLHDEVVKLNQEPKNSKQFYSKNLKNWGVQCLQQWVLAIEGNLSEVIKKMCCESVEIEDYAVFQECFEKAEMITQQIRNNLYRIICSNAISDLADLFIQIYREGFADIACILTIHHFSPELYKRAFKKSIPFQYEKGTYQDMSQKARAYFVAESVAGAKNILPFELRREWKKYAEELEREIMDETAKKFEDSSDFKESDFKESDGQGSNECVMIHMTEQIVRYFSSYFKECTNAFADTLGRAEGLIAFQNEIQQILNSKEQCLLDKILRGDIPEISNRNVN